MWYSDWNMRGILEIFEKIISNKILIKEKFRIGKQ